MMAVPIRTAPKHPSENATAMNLNLLRLTAAAVVVCGALACSSDLTDPNAPFALSLEFNPSVDTLFITDSVVAAPVHLTLSATSLGQPVQTPRGVEWTIADSTIATVDSTGGLRPVSLGTTTLTARVNSEKAHATIVVAQSVTHVLVAPNPVVGFVGDTVTIVASALDRNGALVPGTAYAFTVTDPTTVALSRTSTRTATATFLKAGTARIDVVADGQLGSTTVTIQTK